MLEVTEQRGNPSKPQAQAMLQSLSVVPSFVPAPVTPRCAGGAQGAFSQRNTI